MAKAKTPKVTIPKKLRPMLEPIGDVHLAKKNARKNHDVEAIAASLVEFGYHHTVIATKSGEVIIGNGTYKAAVHLGETEIPVLRVPDDKKKAVRRMVADNRAGELSEWDMDVLGSYEDELDGMADVYDMGDMFPKEPEPPEEFPAFGHNITVEHTCPKCGYAWSGKSTTKKQAAIEGEGDADFE